VDASERIERYKVALEHARFEDENFARIYEGFLLPQTVFLGFVLAATAARDTGQDHRLLAAASLLGLLLCIPWYAATLRNITKVAFRLQQASVAEPADWDVVADTGKKLAGGETVTVGSERFRYGWLSRLIPPRLGLRLIVWLFALAYLVLILAHLNVSFRSLLTG